MNFDEAMQVRVAIDGLETLGGMMFGCALVLALGMIGAAIIRAVGR